MEKTQEDGFPSRRSSMSNICTLCSGPIEAPDTHEFCILCLGLAHGTLNGSGCPHCEEFSVRVLRSRRSVALCDFPRQRLIAANEPLVGRQPHVSDRAERRDSPARSPVCFAEESLRPVPGTLEIILFGAEAGPSLTYSASTHPASVLNTTQVCSGVAQNTDGVALRPLCLFASACRSIPGILD